LKISVRQAEKLSLDQIRAFLEASEAVQFEGEKRQEIYSWVSQTLQTQSYGKRNRAERGLLRSYVAKLTGLSRAQVTRLIGRYLECGEVQAPKYKRHRFAASFTRADIELLAAVDEAHDTLSGPATRRILEREHSEYGRKEYKRLAGISVAHLYNLRKQSRYREKRLHYTKTRPTPVNIGERRRPEPEGRPGYLRIDTVHQGDQDSVKGVYHINAVDEITQWQVMACVAQISEAFLLPALEQILQQFPFEIRGFHSDNGSEYINRSVAQLLNKLLIEQTKSRPRRSNDNGLVETKNGSVIRKHMGYGHIASVHAEAISGFYREHLNPYVNLHRPSAQADVETDAKGRKKRHYRRYQTPLETLLAMPKHETFLRAGQSAEKLRQQATGHSDTEAARQMQAAKQKLFASFRKSA
jgi:transposase InsO family protein/predicted DNA-binding transcriptional regulator AlpA